MSRPNAYPFNVPNAKNGSNRMNPSYSYSQSSLQSAASSTANLLPPTRGPVQAASFPNGHSSLSVRSVTSNGSLNSSAAYSSSTHSLSDKFSLSPDPSIWASESGVHVQEPDDYLHNPDPKRDRKNDKGGTVFTSRGLANLGCLVILVVGLTTLFAGYPLIVYFTRHPLSTLGAFNLGGINSTGQVPELLGNWGLIDIATPNDVYTKTGFDGSEMELVFSDEFNVDNRTFYPGDDPYWEAVDLHYWQTNNLEWYDPSAVTTSGGALHITLSKTPNHDLEYMGGLISTWNKFCFTGGRIEVSVTLPGTTGVAGLWPAVWTMGNLGRAGYGASLEGMWPYTYDSCDVGTLANQTQGGLPIDATINGDPSANGALSFLPGQRLSACTCKGESHPGPLKTDGSLTGRAAPEIDIFEAQVDVARLTGTVSQSAQWAPFNAAYAWPNTTANLIIPDPTITKYNLYMGGAFQQATSCVSDTNQNCYSQSGNGCFAIYGYEYRPGVDNAYITWMNNDKAAWTLNAAGMGPDQLVKIGQRPIPQEPMYIIMNLGISENFGGVDFKHLIFPVTMSIDWIRVYQPKGEKNIGCDPPAFPTQDYINAYIDAYTNPNLTTWRDDYKQPFPKNRLIDNCT
ncbi:beta-glucan synthesis-associated protein [Hysterangium stoloniferum]|nr:beta-glucan synthesis-associated protein [Hysterangium stoloniferum]